MTYIVTDRVLILFKLRQLFYAANVSFVIREQVLKLVSF